MLELKKKNDKVKKPGPSTAQVFWGIVLGAVAGCVPLLSLLEGVLLLLLAVFRTNIVCAVILFAAGKFLTMQYLPETVDRVGLYILTGSDTMVEFSRWFTQLPVITYLNFTNSMVMGGCALGIAGGLPSALFACELVRMFDRKARAKAQAEEKAEQEKKKHPPAPPVKKGGIK